MQTGPVRRTLGGSRGLRALHKWLVQVGRSKVGNWLLLRAQLAGLGFKVLCDIRSYVDANSELVSRVVVFPA